MLSPPLTRTTAHLLTSISVSQIHTPRCSQSNFSNTQIWLRYLPFSLQCLSIAPQIKNKSLRTVTSSGRPGPSPSAGRSFLPESLCRCSLLCQVLSASHLTCADSSGTSLRQPFLKKAFPGPWSRSDHPNSHIPTTLYFPSYIYHSYN